LPTSPQAIAEGLARLRVIHEPHAKRSETVVRAQNAAYVDALKHLEPRWFQAAVNEWVMAKHFPKPGELAATADRFAAAVQRVEETRAALPAPGQRIPGAHLRNEAIQLLGDFDLVMRRTLDEEAYKFVLAECAAWWETQRPEGGLDELTASRRRWRVGRALEDYARARLGMDPLPSLEMTLPAWKARPKAERGGGLRTLKDILNRNPPAEEAAAE